MSVGTSQEDLTHSGLESVGEDLQAFRAVLPASLVKFSLPELTLFSLLVKNCSCRVEGMEKFMFRNRKSGFMLWSS